MIAQIIKLNMSGSILWGTVYMPPAMLVY